MPIDPTLIESGGAVPDRPPADKAVERTLIEARNEGGADERTLLEAQPPPTPGGGVGLNLVPGAQFLEYRLVEPIKVASGEAELWVADGGGRRVVLKFYRWGLHPKAGLSEKLGRISKGHIVEVYGRGTSPDGRDYEILEFIRHGTLADFGKGGLPETKVREVLRELTDAVAALHAENILHRDLKPANVLVRTIEPLNLVLTDFGISSVMDISLHVTSVSRTAAYSAPEAMTGVVSKASDWWSVGVIVMELLQGTQPFAGLDERAINFALVMRGITVPGEVPTAWQSLLKGLLTRDHAKRWHEVQIRQWLEGKGNIPVYYNDATATPVVRIRKHRPCQFLKTEYFEPGELALAMAEQWDEAAKRFERGIISEWIKKEVQNADLASLLIDIQEDPSLNADQKLSVALLAMNERLPLSWHNEVVNREWIVAHPDVALGFFDSRLPAWVKQLRQENWLEELNARYLDLQRRIDESMITKESLLKAALATDEVLMQAAKKVQEEYYSSTDPQLGIYLHKKQLTPMEAAVLALAPPTCFVTRWTAAKENVTEFASNITVGGDVPQALILFPTTKSALNSGIAELHDRRGKLEKELECILGGCPVPSLLQPAVKVVNDLQARFDSLLAERLSAENEVSNELPQLLTANVQFVKIRLNHIEERFSDIDCSQLREFIRNAQRTNAETIILNELPQQLGAGQLRTTKQRLQDIKSQFPDIDCAEIEKSIGGWEAFYQDLSSEMDRMEHDLHLCSHYAGFGKRDANIIKRLQERLAQFKINLDQRQAQLNDQYKDTEFGKLGLQEVARLRRQLAEVDAGKAKIEQQFKTRVANGVFWMFIGVCGLWWGIWLSSLPEAGVEGIILFVCLLCIPGGLGIIAGLRLLGLNKAATIIISGGVAALVVLALLFHAFLKPGHRQGNVSTTSQAASDVAPVAAELKAKGSLRITSDPPGAEIHQLTDEGSTHYYLARDVGRVYGTLLGLTPLELNDLPAEAFSISLHKIGYKLKTVDGKLVPGKTVDWAVTLEPTNKPTMKGGFTLATEKSGFPVASVLGITLDRVLITADVVFNTNKDNIISGSLNLDTNYKGYLEIHSVVNGSFAEKAGWAVGTTIGTLRHQTESGDMYDEFENSDFKALMSNEIAFLEVKDGGRLAAAGVASGDSVVGLDLSASDELLLTVDSVPLVISEVNSNAFAAGINAGDRIVTINGVRLSSWKQLTSIVTNNPNTALQLAILHGDSAFSCVITPMFDTNGIPRLGLMHTNKLVRIRPFKEE